VPLRTCKLNLTEHNIQKGRFKVCLEYHLGNCKGPCEALQSAADYAEGLQQVRNILKGNLGSVINHFKQEMQQQAAELRFEKAEITRKKIEHLENYQARSVIVSSHLSNIDVFSILKEDKWAYVNYLMVQNGTIVQTHTVPLETKLEETAEEVLAFAIGSLRTSFNSLAAEIIVPFQIDYPEKDVVLTIPKGGDKKKLLDLSEKNVLYFKDEIRKKKILHLEGKSDKDKKKVLYELQSYLQLPEVPDHIECFDNSNFQGSFPVSAMVCFKDGVPSKEDYRRFHVKTVEGINDFATMKEVVYRRYKRLLAEEAPLPKLIIIDGGKGQLSAAMESIHELGIAGEVTVTGLAKNEEELFFPGDTESIKLPWDSNSLKLVRRIRDEVHRFGITFHRDKRSKGTFKNELEAVSGIGEQTVQALLKAFKSVKKMREKTEEELAGVVGKAKAKLLRAYFEKEEN
jgi:excinuclease ABC subunit C